MKQIILDVETQKAFDDVGGYYPDRLGVSFVGVIERHDFPEDGGGDEIIHNFFESDLDKLWPLLEAADVIVGFNLVGFDLPTFKSYYSGSLINLPSLDLLERVRDSIGHRISLDAIAKETLGTQKTGHGLDAIRYYRNQEFDKLAHYCMKDVEITRDIYDYGRNNGHIKFKNRWNNLITAEVDFSFSSPDQNLQMTLV